MFITRADEMFPKHNNMSTLHYSCYGVSRILQQNKTTARTLLVFCYFSSFFILLNAKTNCDIIASIHQQRRFGQAFNSSPALFSVCYYRQYLTFHMDAQHLLHCADICIRHNKCKFYDYTAYFGGSGFCRLFEGELHNMDSRCFPKATDRYDHWQGTVNKGFLTKILS